MQDFNIYTDDSLNKLKDLIREEQEKLIVDTIFYINNGGFNTYEDYVNYVNSHNSTEFEYQQHNQFTISIPLPIFSKKLYSYIRSYSIYKHDGREKK